MDEKTDAILINYCLKVLIIINLFIYKNNKKMNEIINDCFG